MIWCICHSITTSEPKRLLGVQKLLFLREVDKNSMAVSYDVQPQGLLFVTITCFVTVLLPVFFSRTFLIFSLAVFAQLSSKHFSVSLCRLYSWYIIGGAHDEKGDVDNGLCWYSRWQWLPLSSYRCGATEPISMTIVLHNARTYVKVVVCVTEYVQDQMKIVVTNTSKVRDKGRLPGIIRCRSEASRVVLEQIKPPNYGHCAAPLHCFKPPAICRDWRQKTLFFCYIQYGIKQTEIGLHFVMGVTNNHPGS